MNHIPKITKIIKIFFYILILLFIVLTIVNSIDFTIFKEDFSDIYRP